VLAGDGPLDRQLVRDGKLDEKEQLCHDC
jgi:hypothetical protein